MSSAERSLPYWQVNVPPALREQDCPPALRNPTEKDLEILETPDAEYHTLTWAEVKDLIARNKLDIFQRKPSDLRRYMLYNYELKRQHGSVMNYILSEKLGWLPKKDASVGDDQSAPIRPRGTPFQFKDDWAVKINDWGYGIDERIKHLVIWTKFDLEENADGGDLTPEARKLIEDFVAKTFYGNVDPDQVCWFKNWQSLKSVHAVEHFHVMLFDPDPTFLKEVTGGDEPASERC